MKAFLILLVLVTLQNMAKASTEQFRGGHPKVMRLLWSGKISQVQARDIQTCVENKYPVNDCIIHNAKNEKQCLNIVENNTVNVDRCLDQAY